ncbi:unnamed protein product, partial [Ectocarpus sp. 4 AP-2014]
CISVGIDHQSGARDVSVPPCVGWLAFWILNTCTFKRVCLFVVFCVREVMQLRARPPSHSAFRRFQRDHIIHSFPSFSVFQTPWYTPHQGSAGTAHTHTLVCLPGELQQHTRRVRARYTLSSFGGSCFVADVHIYTYVTTACAL